MHFFTILVIANASFLLFHNQPVGVFRPVFAFYHKPVFFIYPLNQPAGVFRLVLFSAGLGCKR